MFLGGNQYTVQREKNGSAVITVHAVLIHMLLTQRFIGVIPNTILVGNGFNCKGRKQETTS